MDTTYTYTCFLFFTLLFLFGFATSLSLTAQKTCYVDAQKANNDGDGLSWYDNNKEPLNMQMVLPQSIALHPNPMTNVLHISYISTTTVTYTLYDSTGKQLSNQTHTEKEHQLEVSHLASGTYLLKAKNDTQFKYYRFMKE